MKDEIKSKSTSEGLRNFNHNTTSLGVIVVIIIN